MSQARSVAAAPPLGYAAVLDAEDVDPVPCRGGGSGAIGQRTVWIAGCGHAGGDLTAVGEEVVDLEAQGRVGGAQRGEVTDETDLS